MINKLIDIAILMLAGTLIMIVHELVKAIVYSILSSSKDNKIHIWKLFQYIDPIGLIFCITSFAGFSKPYMYRIKEKRINFILGLVGFLTLLLIFLASISTFVYFNGQNFISEANGSININIHSVQDILLYYLSICSLGMFIVNLFPISTFDMGLLIAGKSPSKYFSIIKNDLLIKMILIISILANVVVTLIGIIFHIFITI